MSNRVPKSISVDPGFWREVEEAAATTGTSISQYVVTAIAAHLRTRVSRDAWDMIDEDEAYDVRSFFTASEDRRGHSSTVKANVPKNLMGQMARIVNSGQIAEYRSLSDFVRDAVHHRAKQVGVWLDDGELLSEVDFQMMSEEEVAIARKREEFEALMTQLRENGRQALERGDYRWLRTHLQDRSQRSSSIPERFRSEFLDLLGTLQAELDEKDPPTELDSRRRRRRAQH